MTPKAEPEDDEKITSRAHNHKQLEEMISNWKAARRKTHRQNPMLSVVPDPYKIDFSQFFSLNRFYRVYKAYFFSADTPLFY